MNPNIIDQYEQTQAAAQLTRASHPEVADPRAFVPRSDEEQKLFTAAFIQSGKESAERTEK